jgi:hypothetical protein
VSAGRVLDAPELPAEPPHGSTVLDRDGVPWQRLADPVQVLNGWGGSWSLWSKPWGAGVAPLSDQAAPHGALMWPLLLVARGPLTVVNERPATPRSATC